MEMVKHNLVYDLLQTTKLSSNIDMKRENDKILRRFGQVNFVICNSCYWCASYFGIDDLESSHVLDCHACNSHNTKFIPISTDDSLRIDLAN
jgi:ribosomal protein L36